MRAHLFTIICLLLGAAYSYAQTELEVKSILDLLNCNDVYGYADQGREYAIVGRVTGTSIVDLTDPYNPVELFDIPGPESTWRDMKTWDHYAYVVNEEAEGLLIIDLQNLPESIDTWIWDADGLFSTAHNIFIDEKGFAYLVGYNDEDNSISTDDRGALMINLVDEGQGFGPTNPRIVGRYSERYIHDAYVRGDTMWAAEIYEGTLTAVDVSDKQNPQILGSQATPSVFAHACWPTDDSSVMFTADEKVDSYIAAYDVTDVNDIRELDRYQSSPGDSVIPHNLLVLDELLYISYYTDGVRVLDITRPDIMVEVGYYDTSPEYEGPGYRGCWGVYPYLPSGTILGSDRQMGLYCLASDGMPEAAYLTGTVTDAQTGDPVNKANITFANPTLDSNNSKSQANGGYKTGAPGSGTYVIEYSCPGYISQSHAVELLADEEVVFDVVLEQVPIAPEANFTVGGTVICDGANVNYTDLSTNSPNVWAWAFPGGNPSTSQLQNPSVKYPEAGTFEVILTSSNFAGSSTYVMTVEVEIDFGPELVATPVDSPCPDANAGGFNYYVNEVLAPDADINVLLYNSSGTLISPTAPLSPGTYTLKVGIDDGCFAEQVFEVSEPDAFELEVTVIQPTGLDAGSISLGDISGGTGPYLISWNGETPGPSYSIEAAEAGFYELTVIDADSCLYEETFEILEHPVLIEHSAEQILQIFPQPADDHLILNTALASELMSFRMFDAVGREISVPVQDAGFDSYNLQTSHLAEGLYVLQTKSPLGTFTSKILIAH